MTVKERIELNKRKAKGMLKLVKALNDVELIHAVCGYLEALDDIAHNQCFVDKCFPDNGDCLLDIDEMN